MYVRFPPFDPGLRYTYISVENMSKYSIGHILKYSTLFGGVFFKSLNVCKHKSVQIHHGSIKRNAVFFEGGVGGQSLGDRLLIWHPQVNAKVIFYIQNL